MTGQTRLTGPDVPGDFGAPPALIPTPPSRRYAALAVAAAVLIALALLVVAAGAGSLVSPRNFLLGCAAASAVALLVIVARARPSHLLCAGLVLTIFSGHWDYVGLPPLVTPDRLLIAAGVIAALARVPAAGDGPRLRPAYVFIVAFVVFALASSFLADTLLGTPAEQFDRIGIAAFACFIVAPLAFADRRDRQVLAWTLAGLGAYLGLTALLEIVAPAAVFPGYISDGGLEQRHFGRARGPFVEAEVNGFALFACALAALIAREGTARKAWRAVALGIAILCAVGVLLTLTRAPWLGATLGTVLAMLTVPSLRAWILPLAIAAALTVMLTFAVIPGLADRAGERASNQETIWDRQNLNTAGINMFLEAPLVGHGWSTFQRDANDYFWMARDYPLNTIRAKTGLHNQVLLRLAEVGLVGTTLWLLAIGLALLGAFRGPREDDLVWWRAALVALITCYVVLILTTPAAHPYQLLLLLLWAGVATGRGGLDAGPRGAARAA